MKAFTQFTRGLLLALSLAGASAHANVLYTTTTFLTTADPVQLGRLSRNGVAGQDWAGSEVYPGFINLTTSYHYRLFAINVGMTPYLQISFDSVPTNTFVSAYQSNYNPLSPATGWLGDAGYSGNSFGTDPLFFNVVAALNSVAYILVNETVAANGGTGAANTFGLLVEGFVDTQYTDFVPSAVPEPSTILLLAPLVLVAGLSRRRKRAGAQPALAA